MSKKFKLCCKGSSIWYCWCFDSTLSDDDRIRPMTALPRYHRVCCITVKSKGNLCFLWCDCGFYDRIRIPCSHLFRVIGVMTLNMFHIRHWRYYKAYYNYPTPIGQHLVQAQKEHFDNEGMGVRLLNEQMDNIMQKLSNDVTSRCNDDSITRSSNTTMND